MKQESQEILLYESYNQNDKIFIHIPVQNLIEPKFLLKEKDLYIFLYNYKQAYIIKNLKPTIINEIINGNCFICEAINAKRKYPITLHP